MNPGPPTSDSFFRIDAAAAADGRGAAFAPVSVLLEPPRPGPDGVGKLLAIGSPGEVDGHPAAARARRVDRHHCLLIPGLVNAHCHLDLTHIGPRPYDARAGFGSFVDLVRRERRTEDDGLAASMDAGIRLSRAGGVVALGDIAGAPRGMPSLAPFRRLGAAGTGGASYLEFFSIGKGEQSGRERIAETLRNAREGDAEGSLALGLEPHAPTTVSVSTYRWLLADPEMGNRRLSTHLAETPAEREFIAHGRGTHRAFLESLGLWEDRMLEEIGRGRTPVEHMAEVLREAPFLCAHVNDASDGDIAVLARTPTSVAYCPRASDYFRAQDHFGPHRYRDMLGAGINVCLGTDSIINLPGGTDRLSTLDEARFLYRRDGTDPVTLLRMATINGAKALGIDDRAFAFEVGSELAGVVAVPFEQAHGPTPLAGALAGESEPELLAMRG
jgi:cytosine/adenosine deaminase-related metal-dependent hydrolase